MRNIIKPIFLFALILNCELLFAQSMFKEGFVILNSGDSLKGLIDYRGDHLMAKECRFKESLNSELIIYSPSQLKAFGFINSKYYVSREYENKRYFFEYLINGEIDILYLRAWGEGDYYIEKDTIPLTKLVYEKGLREKDGKFYSYESTVHNGILNLFIQDTPQMTDKANSIGKPNDKNLVRFAKNYHEEVCPTEDCIIYQQGKMPFKVALELNTYYSDFRQEAEYFLDYGLNASNAIQTGITVHIWMPKTSEKIFIRTGLSFANLAQEGQAKLVYKTPLMIEYLYPKYRIRPHFAYGLNFYSPFTHTAGFNTGFNVVFTDRFHLRVNYEMDYRTAELFPLAPVEFFSSGIGGGVYLKF